MQKWPRIPLSPQYSPGMKQFYVYGKPLVFPCNITCILLYFWSKSALDEAKEAYKDLQAVRQQQAEVVIKKKSSKPPPYKHIKVSGIFSDIVCRFFELMKAKYLSLVERVYIYHTKIELHLGPSLDYKLLFELYSLERGNVLYTLTHVFVRLFFRLWKKTLTETNL